MRTFLLALILFCSCFTSQAQQEHTTALISCSSDTEKPTDWTIYFENEMVKIEYVFTDCDPNIGYDYEGVMLRVTNKTATGVQLSWKKSLYYDGSCATCGSEHEGGYTLNLNPGESVEGDCDPQPEYDIKILSKYNDVNFSQGNQLTAFQLERLTILQE